MSRTIKGSTGQKMKPNLKEREDVINWYSSCDTLVQLMCGGSASYQSRDWVYMRSRMLLGMLKFPLPIRSPIPNNLHLKTILWKGNVAT